MWLFNFIASRFSASAAWSAITWMVPLAAAVLAAGAAGAISWKLGRAPLQAEITQMQLAQATAAIRQADAQALRMSQAQAKSDALALALGNTVVHNLSLTLEISNALKTATDGRACLRGRALSLLGSAPGIRIAPPVPESGAAAAAEGAAAAADPLSDAAKPEQVITDTALAIWAAQAGGLYETCRLRLDALIDWHATPSLKK